MKPQYKNTKYKKYLCEYRFDNKQWAIEIHANSLSEAQQKLKSISSGNVLGEGNSVPAFLGWYVRALVWWRNFVSH